MTCVKLLISSSSYICSLTLISFPQTLTHPSSSSPIPSLRLLTNFSSSSSYLLSFSIQLLLKQQQLIFTAAPSTKTSPSIVPTKKTSVTSSISYLRTPRKTEFYNITVADDADADTGNPSDTVYGLFMCRNNIAPHLCHQCFRHAANRLAFDYCSYSKEAIIWYEDCMVRYSICSFFSTVDTWPKFVVYNTAHVDSDQSTFWRLLFNTMNVTADEAAKPAVGEKKYATKQVNISRSHSLYCAAQCTLDLSPKDCRSCLSLASGEFPCCTDLKQGGRALYPSCDVRYESHHFF